LLHVLLVHDIAAGQGKQQQEGENSAHGVVSDKSGST